MGRTLAAMTGMVHIEVDRFHTEPPDVARERRIERTEWIAAYRAAYIEVEEALTAGKSVAFDAVSYRRLQRDRIRRIATNHGVAMTIIYLDVPPAVARARMIENRLTPRRPNVPDADFDEVCAGMQPPMADEIWVAYKPSEPLEDWIRREIGAHTERKEKTG
jgi:predicted kinase